MPEAASNDIAQLVLKDVATGAILVTLAEARGSMPEKGAEVAVGLRKVVNRYPGNSATSTQVMGSEDEPIEFNGWFRDAWLGGSLGVAVEDGALELVDTMNRAVRAGKLVELAWGELLVRRGFVDKFVAIYHTRGAIKWRLTFEVSEADDADVIGTPTVQSATARDLTEILEWITYYAELSLDVATEINNVGHALVA